MRLSDGGGAIVFFRTLLAEYLRQTGAWTFPAGNGVLDLNEPPREEELEDAYARYAGRARLRPAAAAEGLSEYRHAGAVLHLPCHDGLRAAAPACSEQAKKHNASITEYLSAVLIHVILEKQKRGRALP